MKNKFSCASVLFLVLFAQNIYGQGMEEWSSIEPDYSNLFTNDSLAGEIPVPDISNQLFIGTSSNVNIPDGTTNDVFAVNLNNTSQSILSANGIWGATADTVNQRILFTQSSGLTPPPDFIGGGDNLFELPYTGGSPSLIGRVTLNGEGLRLDGLAMRKGLLYGYGAGNGDFNGFYHIDLDTLEASLIANPLDSISGLDADPKTCIIYGTNDTTGQLVRLDTSGNVTDVAPYPVGIDDIDGLAVGEGYAYLITDEDQDISVLNLSTLMYEATLASPFLSADTFSGGALAIQDPASNLDTIFDNSFEFDYCAD